LGDWQAEFITTLSASPFVVSLNASRAIAPSLKRLRLSKGTRACCLEYCRRFEHLAFDSLDFHQARRQVMDQRQVQAGALGRKPRARTDLKYSHSKSRPQRLRATRKWIGRRADSKLRIFFENRSFYGRRIGSINSIFVAQK
jgi:hypothetical protein